MNTLDNQILGAMPLSWAAGLDNFREIMAHASGHYYFVRIEPYQPEEYISYKLVDGQWVEVKELPF